eukprot:9509936-Alexandrium_andersonii.AAC.1
MAEISRTYWRRHCGPDHDPAAVLRECYMAAGNRRAARRYWYPTGKGRIWVVNLATNALGWERDLTEDGD